MACFRIDVTMTLAICANSRSQARWIHEPDAGAWWTPQLRRPKELSSVGIQRERIHALAGRSRSLRPVSENPIDYPIRCKIHPASHPVSG
jgi:hypothetical protein